MDSTRSAGTRGPLVNGPEGVLFFDWHGVDWAGCEKNVRRLRQRIFKATREGDLRRVRNLQKLMLRSRSNTLVSVRRVTQHSSGRMTAGIDGERALTPKARGMLAAEVHRSSKPWTARPVRRVFIPKGKGKQRPLGIPVIRDRVLQARVKNALEPEWEARFEPRSYGFRPGRSCQDAIYAVFGTVKGKCPKRLWVLDADLTAAFDRIDHTYLMAMLGRFPAREQVRGWLEAGVIDGGRFAPSPQGTPQGGVISPLLLNIALHGMEQAAGCRYTVRAGRASGAAPGTPVLVRYADDFVVLCHDEEQVYQVRDRLGGWLEVRGLAFNEDKTHIVQLDEGFDFLGFTVRRRNGKLITTPSAAACARLRAHLRAEVKALQGANAEAVLRRLTPIVRGWAAYYRTVASSRTFSSMDHYMWRLVFKWARRRHRNKPGYWVVDRYFGQFHPSRRDRWVFGDRASGAFLTKFAWTGIVRHRLVRGGASVDDPDLAEYWSHRRRRKALPPMDKTSLVLAVRQQGLCPLCGQALIAGAEYEPDSPREWINWFAASKKMLHKHHFTHRRAGGTDTRNNLRLVHSECHRQHHAGDSQHVTPPCTPAKPPGACLSRMRRKTHVRF